MPILVDALFQGHDTSQVLVIYQTHTFKKIFFVCCFLGCTYDKDIHFKISFYPVILLAYVG